MDFKGVKDKNTRMNNLQVVQEALEVARQGRDLHCDCTQTLHHTEQRCDCRGRGRKGCR